MTGKKISCFFDSKIYRDTANASTLFAGADAYTGNWLLKEYDLHYKKDSLGSAEEYIK
jgi:hypothetical protein